MVKFLKLLGYAVENPSGKNHVIINTIDFIALLIYTGLSFWSLWKSGPSFIVWIVNMIMLCRIIISNYIEETQLKEIMQEKIKNDDFYNSYNINKEEELPSSICYKLYNYKLTVGITLFFVIIFLTIIGLSYGENFVINSGEAFGVIFGVMVILILVFTLLEDILRIIERLFKAKPEPFVRLSNK